MTTSFIASMTISKGHASFFYATLCFVLAALIFPWSLSHRKAEGFILGVFSTTAETLRPTERTSLPMPSSEDDTTRDSPLPTLAWLMSFPNSWTSYTLMNTYTVTERLVGTNYNLAPRPHPDHFPRNNPQGPFLLPAALPQEKQQQPSLLHIPLLPTTNLLTKTHCTAYCVDCPPQNFANLSVQAFAKGCRTVKERNQTTLALSHSVYPASWVTKAVHLIRNPFDNLVARMHLSLRDGNQTGREDSPATRQTLLAWCQETADAYKDDFFNASFLDKDVQEILQTLPCPLEWYRWVQWHNLAIQTTQQLLKIQVHYVHYETYTTNFNQTVATLLEFLNLPAVGSPVSFVQGKTYRYLYTSTERRIAAQVVRSLATPACWERVHHYFEEEGEEDDGEVIA